MVMGCSAGLTRSSTEDGWAMGRRRVQERRASSHPRQGQLCLAKSYYVPRYKALHQCYPGVVERMELSSQPIKQWSAALAGLKTGAWTSLHVLPKVRITICVQPQAVGAALLPTVYHKTSLGRQSTGTWGMAKKTSLGRYPRQCSVLATTWAPLHTQRYTPPT